MVFDDLDDDNDEEGAELEDPDNPPDSLDLDEPVITGNPLRATESTDPDDSRELDYSLDEPDDEFENFINRTYVCEDCDFRWAEKIYPERNDYPDYDDEMGHAHICPMCGSMNVSFY